MDNQIQTNPEKRFGFLHALLIMIIILLVAILGSLWWLKSNVYAREFKPVELDKTEQAELETKLEIIAASQPEDKSLQAKTASETYTEKASARDVVITERELNSLFAGDPVISRNVAIDLDDDLISVKIITPMEQGIPVLGGKTFKLSMGVTLQYKDGKPVVIMRGISLGGIPLPSAWWGDIKGRNLVEEFGQEGGFWDMFAKGVEHLEIKNGKLILKLKE